MIANQMEVLSKTEQSTIAAESDVRDLNELQLALVGGGIGETAI